MTVRVRDGYLRGWGKPVVLGDGRRPALSVSDDGTALVVDVARGGRDEPDQVWASFGRAGVFERPRPIGRESPAGQCYGEPAALACGGRSWAAWQHATRPVDDDALVGRLFEARDGYWVELERPPRALELVSPGSGEAWGLYDHRGELGVVDLTHPAAAFARHPGGKWAVRCQIDEGTLMVMDLVWEGNIVRPRPMLVTRDGFSAGEPLPIDMRIRHAATPGMLVGNAEGRALWAVGVPGPDLDDSPGEVWICAYERGAWSAPVHLCDTHPSLHADPIRAVLLRDGGALLVWYESGNHKEAGGPDRFRMAGVDRDRVVERIVLGNDGPGDVSVRDFGIAVDDFGDGLVYWTGYRWRDAKTVLVARAIVGGRVTDATAVLAATGPERVLMETRLSLSERGGSFFVFLDNDPKGSCLTVVLRRDPALV